MGTPLQETRESRAERCRREAEALMALVATATSTELRAHALAAAVEWLRLSEEINQEA